MSPAAGTQRKSSSRKKKNTSPGWLSWWPLLLGILVSPLTVRAAGVMALAGPDALRVLYPYVLLLQAHIPGLPGDVASMLSQGMMYLQFPLYGLLMSVLLRARGLATAIVTAAVLHFGAVALLIAIGHD